MAGRLFGQAVAYLITAMEKWGEKLEIGCGPLVDIAVHGFILDTRNYREFCDRHFGRFLKHIPAIDFRHDGPVERTAHSIEATGSRSTGRSGRPSSPSSHLAPPVATATDPYHRGVGASPSPTPDDVNHTTPPRSTCSRNLLNVTDLTTRDTP
ncbi:hypothetical protein [Actinomadura darangshiensis]|uniref:hypothetical protein n=1 Tax=Actinomadura darangshiensis TaxID=705336 RepID=UPI001FB657D2|nr:hypothetical protein [Actinomadura darangshiensis]